MNLLQRSTMDLERRHNWRDWLFLSGLILLMVLLIAVPITILWLAIHLLRRP
jgi:hypothetical protein